MKLDILFHYNVDEQTGEITYIGKEEIKVETLKNKTDSWWTTIMFKIIVKDGFAPMYILKYMIIEKP